MTIANFQYPINLYGENITVEDWLTNFTVESTKEEIERYPNNNIALTIADVIIEPTTLGNKEITRTDLIALFSETAVREQEFTAGQAYLNDNTL